MPVNVKVFRPSDFVRASHEGPATLELAEQLLRDIALAGARLGDFQVLVDVRHVTVPLTASELWQLAEKLSAYRRKLGDKMAILCPAQRFDHAYFYSLCAQGKGFNVRPFTSYEPAMEWLLDEPDAQTH
jgi:hypothetical protein